MTEPKIIQKRSDPVVRHLRQIRDRDIPHLLFCEGFKLVQELLESPLLVEGVYCHKKLEGNILNMLIMSKRKNIPITYLNDQTIDFVSDLTTSPGIIAVARKPDPPSEEIPSEKKPLILVIHQIQLPQNVGALIRTAEATGVTEIWTTTKTADPFGPKALRGASGSSFRLPIRTGLPLHEAIALLSKNKIRVVAATQEGHTRYDKVPWDKPTALVMGSEGSGFTIEEMKYLKDTLSIPMKGRVESLNVATAAAICLFEASKHR